MSADSCSHTFSWHSVIPATHCPMCGACLGCGQGARPPYSPYPYVQPYPQPMRPWYPSAWPYWQGPTATFTYTTNTGGNYAH